VSGQRKRGKKKRMEQRIKSASVRALRRKRRIWDRRRKKERPSTPSGRRRKEGGDWKKEPRKEKHAAGANKEGGDPDNSFGYSRKNRRGCPLHSGKPLERGGGKGESGGSTKKRLQENDEKKLFSPK